MRDKIEIAFRRKVRAVWLEQGLVLAAQDLPWKEAKPHLATEIAGENPGAETIRKVLEHVRRIWFEPPDDSLALRSDALRIFQADDSPDTRLVLNWGMTIAAYPFVGCVGEALGRLLKLQTGASRSDVQRRLREQYGDRDFVNRITRYNISTFLDWGIIAETKGRSGSYTLTKQTRPKRPEHIAWLAEAVLISREQNQMAFSQLSHHPILFPVVFDAVNPSILRTNPRLKVSRQALNEDVVSLDHPINGALPPPRLHTPALL